MPGTGCWTWGEETPDTDTPISWQNWHLVNGASIDGDSDWGKIKVGSVGGDYAVSEVKEYPDDSAKTFTITVDAYGAGSGESKISIRGQATSFAWDDAEPAWEEYIVPVYKSWKYIQIKVEWKV